MTRQMVRSCFVCALATFVAVAVANLAGATGYWNMPCTACQWCGHGFGGGYHAPLMLGPPTHECCSAPNEVRLPYAPNPYGCAPYCNGNGGGCGYGAGGPAMMPPNAMAPNPQPAPGPQQNLQAPPAANPESAIFAPPVQSQGGSW